MDRLCYIVDETEDFFSVLASFSTQESENSDGNYMVHMAEP